MPVLDRAALVCGVLTVALMAPRPALGQAAQAGQAGQAGQAAPAGKPVRELNFVPIAGGDSDVGIGGGGVGNLASLVPGQPGFRWRLELQAFVTFKVREAEGLVMPFQDYSLQLVVPRWGADGGWRVDARISFTDEATLKYTGIGNASPTLAPGLPVARGEYARLHPTASLEMRRHVVGPFYLLGGSALTYNRLTVAGDSVLAMEQAAGPPEVRALLGGFGAHTVELLTLEAQIDTRDDEIVTRRGQFHTLRVRVSPPIGGTPSYSYERLTFTTRFYAMPVERWLKVAFRLVGDALFGDAPFYELARFDETPALGGSKAVRGVPAQRYYGKVKAFGNVEVSSELLPFTLRKKPFILGVAAFFDAGRSWTELSRAHPELDGTGVGLKYGVGGGLRIQEGKTFLLRLDLAWSPDARPVGAYFAAGSIF